MDANFVMRKQFAKLHERVQTKYDEMQRKLEKSKSIDMLTRLDEDFTYENRKYVSTNDLSEIDETILNTPENGRKIFCRAVIADQVYYRNNVILKEICFDEATISEAVSQSSLCDRSESENDDRSVEHHFFGNNYLNTSLESLNEMSQGDDSLPPTPPPKLIRKRISWLRAAKEKRKHIEKEKIFKTRKKDERNDTFDRVNRYILSNTAKHEPLKTFKRTKIAAVTIALIEASGFDEAPEDKSRVLGCRFRLGSEKRKSKAIRSHEKVIKWQEMHHFNLFDDDSILEITLHDKDDLLGRKIIDLSELKKETTHKLSIKLDYSANIKLFILLTITGTHLINSVYDIDEAARAETAVGIRDKYAWYRLCGKFSNVGYLSVIVYGAKGLPGNDWHCVLNLNNERVQTPTDYKTNAPNWMRIFSFTLSDITSILEITICDEKKCEEHSRVYIPLLSIEEGKKWYALKEKHRDRAKGHNPRILLEMSVTWNLVKASVRVINPKEVNYLQTEDKLDRHVFAKNLTRSKAVLAWVLNAFQVFRSAFEWESRKWNLIALIFWQLFCWFFKLWMLPLLLLIPFIWYRPEDYYLFNWARRYIQNISIISSRESKQYKEEKSLTLRQKITNFQETLQTVQNFLGKFASLGERIKNLFNFSVPFVSFLAIFFISAIAFVIYLIPLRYILMGWGVHKFTRKILRPNRIPNNEMMDLLSRVPDDNTLMDCEGLPLENISDEDESLTQRGSD